MQEKIRGIIVTHTGQPLETVTRDMDRDFYLPAEEAKEYGLVDDMLGSAEEDE